MKGHVVSAGAGLPGRDLYAGLRCLAARDRLVEH